MSGPDDPVGRDDSAEAPEVGRDEPSPVADNAVAEDVSTTVHDDHLVAASSRGPVDLGVTPGMQIASAWAWRFLVIVAAVAVIGWGMRYVSEVVVPVTVGILLTALLIPVTKGLQRLRLPRGPAAGITVIGTIALVAGLLTLVGTQIATQFDKLSTQVGEGAQKARDLLRINFGVSEERDHRLAEPAPGSGDERWRTRPAGHRGRDDGHPCGGRAVHRAVLPVLLPLPG